MSLIILQAVGSACFRLSSAITILSPPDSAHVAVHQQERGGNEPPLHFHCYTSKFSNPSSLLSITGESSSPLFTTFSSLRRSTTWRYSPSPTLSVVRS